MKHLFLKELREQLGVILLGIFMAFAFIVLFRIKMPDSTMAEELLEHHRLLENTFLLMFVVYAAAFSNALAGDRDRGDRFFASALPVHPLMIWSAKILSACTAIAMVHIAVALLGLIFGFHELTMFVVLTDLPQPLVFIMLLSIISALICSALFQRSFTVLITAILMVFTVTLVTSFVQMLWNWRSLMEWPLFASLIMSLFLSAMAFTSETRHLKSARKTAWLVSAGLLFLSGFTMSAQYRHETCRPPDPHYSDIIHYIPTADRLLVMADSSGPLYQLESDGSSHQRIGRRFETTGKNPVSADGRFLILYSNRGCGGSTLAAFARQSRVNPLSPVREFVDGQPPIDLSDFGWSGETIFIVDLETGSRTAIPSSELGKPYRAEWYNHASQLAVLYLKRSGENDRTQTSLAILQSDGSVIRTIEGQPDDGYFRIGDDDSTIIRYKLMEFPENDMPRIRASFRTVLSPDWKALDQWFMVPSVSPDHRWIAEYTPETEFGWRSLQARSQEDENQQVPFFDHVRLQFRSREGDIIPAGDTANWEMKAWSPSSKYLIYSISPRTSGSTLMLFSTSDHTITELPASLSTVFREQFAAWDYRVVFSLSENRIAFCGHTPNGTTLVYDIEQPERTHVLPGGYPVGWLNNDHLLIKQETSLVILNTLTGSRRPFDGPHP